MASSSIEVMESGEVRVMLMDGNENNGGGGSLITQPTSTVDHQQEPNPQHLHQEDVDGVSTTLDPELDAIEGLDPPPGTIIISPQELVKQGSFKKGFKTEASTEIPVACEQCGKVMMSGKTLVQHMAIHSDIKPFQCPHCPKSFARKVHLQGHLVVHGIEKQFECPVCHQRFSRQDCVKVHMRLHDKSKCVYCDVCHKAFLTVGALNIHLRIHRGEKPFKCHLCGKCFTQKNHLITHIKRHTKVTDEHFTKKLGPRMFKCEHCPRSFIRLSDYERHVQWNHGAVADQNIVDKLPKVSNLVEGETKQTGVAPTIFKAPKDSLNAKPSRRRSKKIMCTTSTQTDEEGGRVIIPRQYQSQMTTTSTQVSAPPTPRPAEDDMYENDIFDEGMDRNFSSDDEEGLEEEEEDREKVFVMPLSIEASDPAQDAAFDAIVGKRNTSSKVDKGMGERMMREQGSEMDPAENGEDVDDPAAQEDEEEEEDEEEMDEEEQNLVSIMSVKKEVSSSQEQSLSNNEQTKKIDSVSQDIKLRQTVQAIMERNQARMEQRQAAMQDQAVTQSQAAVQSQTVVQSQAVIQGQVAMQDQGTMQQSQVTMQKDQGAMQEGPVVKQEGQSVKHEAQSSMRKAKGAMQEAQGPIQEAQGAIQEAQGPMQDAQGPMQEAQGPMQEAQGPMQEAQGPVENEASIEENDRMEVVELCDKMPTVEEISADTTDKGNEEPDEVVISLDANSTSIETRHPEPSEVSKSGRAHEMTEAISVITEQEIQQPPGVVKVIASPIKRGRGRPRKDGLPPTTTLRAIRKEFISNMEEEGRVKRAPRNKQHGKDFVCNMKGCEICRPKGKKGSPTVRNRIKIKVESQGKRDSVRQEEAAKPVEFEQAEPQDEIAKKMEIARGKLKKMDDPSKKRPRPVEEEKLPDEAELLRIASIVKYIKREKDDIIKKDDRKKDDQSKRDDPLRIERPGETVLRPFESQPRMKAAEESKVKVDNRVGSYPVDITASPLTNKRDKKIEFLVTSETQQNAVSPPVELQSFCIPTYSCKLCGREFRFEGKLHRHIESVHQNKPIFSPDVKPGRGSQRHPSDQSYQYQDQVEQDEEPPQPQQPQVIVPAEPENPEIAALRSEWDDDDDDDMDEPEAPQLPPVQQQQQPQQQQQQQQQQQPRPVKKPVLPSAIVPIISSGPDIYSGGVKMNMTKLAGLLPPGSSSTTQPIKVEGNPPISSALPTSSTSEPALEEPEPDSLDIKCKRLLRKLFDSNLLQKCGLDADHISVVLGRILQHYGVKMIEDYGQGQYEVLKYNLWRLIEWKVTMEQMEEFYKDGKSVEEMMDDIMNNRVPIVSHEVQEEMSGMGRQRPEPANTMQTVETVHISDGQQVMLSQMANMVGGPINLPEGVTQVVLAQDVPHDLLQGAQIVTIDPTTGQVLSQVTADQVILADSVGDELEQQVAALDGQAVISQTTAVSVAMAGTATPIMTQASIASAGQVVMAVPQMTQQQVKLEAVTHSMVDHKQPQLHQQQQQHHQHHHHQQQQQQQQQHHHHHQQHP